MREHNAGHGPSREAMGDESPAPASMPRRQFLELSATATAGALGLHALGEPAEAGSEGKVPGLKLGSAKGVIMLDRVKVSVFEACIGETFLARADDESTHELELIEAEALEPRPGVSHLGIREDPFSLMFLASKSSQLGQGLYTMSHAKLGKLALFIVPVGPGPAGAGVRFQAVFN